MLRRLGQLIRSGRLLGRGGPGHGGKALSRETTYATVTLTIVGPKAKPATHPRQAPPSLAGGLGAGWHALRVTVSWTLAFLGAVAPFAVVAALAAFVVYRGRRWLTRRRPAAGPASPEN